MTAPALESLADKSYWEGQYFGSARPPLRLDDALPIERCMARRLDADAPVGRGARVLEVGCAPGAWLVHYAERFGAAVEGVEYSEKGVDLTRANLAACGVGGTIHHSDFFAFEGGPFDLVLSLGFIEHFEDLSTTFGRHVALTAPGGRLAIGVPNLRGLNRLLASRLDPAHLERHNLEAMRPSVLRQLVQDHGLIVESLGYLGGPDPIVVSFDAARRRTPATYGALGVVVAETALRRLRAADRLNHRLVSSYLLAVMRRPG